MPGKTPLLLSDRTGLTITLRLVYIYYGVKLFLETISGFMCVICEFVEVLGDRHRTND